MNVIKEQNIDKQDQDIKEPHQEQASLSSDSTQEAAPLREQRQRRNLRLPGNVDVESVGGTRYSLKDNRRESWIDRMNQAAKNALKRSSYIATETDRPLIDKVADSMNKYDNEDDESEKETWTDKIMNLLFPSLQHSSSKVEPEIIKETRVTTAITPEIIPSDDHYDDVQGSTNDIIKTSWTKEATDLAQEVDKHALNQHPDKKVTIESSDDIYDDAQAELPDLSTLEILTSDANRPYISDKHKNRPRSKSLMTDHQLQRLKDQKMELENQPPPQFRSHPPYDVVDNKKERHRLRKQKMVEEQDILGKQSHFDNDFENWTARPRQL
ncbi:unnamed protein product [Cunninghamella echinulata]